MNGHAGEKKDANTTIHRLGVAVTPSVIPGVTTTMKILDVSSIQNIPGYVEILKFVLKSQIQNLVEQLQDHAGEETLVLSANLTAGTLSHIESDRGQGFLDVREDIKSQFLTHCLQGKQKYHTAEPPGHGAAALVKPTNTLSSESGSTRSSQTDSNKDTQEGNFGFPQTDNRVTLPDADGFSLTDANRQTQSGNSDLNRTHFHRLPQPGSIGLTQVSDKRFPYSSSSLSTLDFNTRLSHTGIIGLSEQVTEGASAIQFLDRDKDLRLHSKSEQSNKEELISSQNSSKVSLASPFLPGTLANLPTINHSAVKDFISFSLNTHVLPQYIQPYQGNLTPLKLIDGTPDNVTTIKPAAVTNLVCEEKGVNSESLSVNQAKCHLKSQQSTNTISQENTLGVKTKARTSLLHETHAPDMNCQQNVSLQDQVLPAKEQVNKTTKRKQKRGSSAKPQSKNVSLLESPSKKTRMFEPQFTQNSALDTDHLNTLTSGSQSKDATELGLAASEMTDLSCSTVPTTSEFSLLKMQPVVLIDESSKSSRQVFIETGSVNQTNRSGKSVLENPRSLIFEPNTHLASTSSGAPKHVHVADAKEKDKTKKTLSSKIDEITKRIKKDDAIKQHTVQTSDDDKIENTSVCFGTSRSASMNVDSGNVEAGRQDMTTPPSAEPLGDGDPSKLKDGSRASHRKPKLPRFNIGVASDDEDNAEVSESPNSVTQEGSANPFGTPPTSVGLGHDDSQDIINIQVGTDDSETAFPHINLEELADGLLLADIPIVSYYNSVEDSGKSLIENVFNLKPGRDPGSKKPLNSQSVIVSGSKLEKDWVKCPLCPDKFLTVEALQYHIKNVNHVIKKYECDLCKRKFSQLRDMERHRRIHTGEKPFTCDICHKSFSRKDNLKSHTRKHSLK